MLQAGMGACRRSPARKQHLGLPGGAAGAMDFTCIYFWHGCVAVCGVIQQWGVGGFPPPPPPCFRVMPSPPPLRSPHASIVLYRTCVQMHCLCVQKSAFCLIKRGARTGFRPRAGSAPPSASLVGNAASAGIPPAPPAPLCRVTPPGKSRGKSGEGGRWRAM